MGTLNDSDLMHLLGEAADSQAVPECGPDLIRDAYEEQGQVVPLRRRRWVQVSAVAAVAALWLTVGASFVGNSDDRIGQLAGAGRAEQTAPTAAEAGPKALTFSRDTAATGGVAAPMPAAAAPRTLTDQVFAAAGSAGTASTTAAAPQQAPTATDGARIVKTGAIALVVKDGQVTDTLTRVQGFAQAVGGLVAAATTQESGPTPSGEVTLRVPVARFETIVAQVRNIKAEVRSATTSGQDVTAQYADLEAQLRTLTAARERFLGILGRADTIGDVLAVQQRVDDVTGRIDRLEGQRKVLAAQSDSATLQVSVTEADDPMEARAKADSGLSKAFKDAGTGFTTGVEALIRLSGRGTLLALLAVAAYALVRLGLRVSRRRLL